MDLEHILHSQGFGTRRQCRALIRSGAVTIGRVPCADPSSAFDVAAADAFWFAVDGVNWLYRRHAYIALHKPAGYECSRTPQHHPSVFTLLPRQMLERGVQSVGRLDQDTTGLLLLSDDGSFVHALTAPKRKVPKVYRVTTKHELDAAQLAALLDGVALHGESAPLAAGAAVRLDSRLLELTIQEGKYHQVKRMVAAAGNRVAALHRHAIGGLALPPDLAAGAWRWLDAGDLALLRA